MTGYELKVTSIELAGYSVKNDRRYVCLHLNHKGQELLTQMRVEGLNPNDTEVILPKILSDFIETQGWKYTFSVGSWVSVVEILRHDVSKEDEALLALLCSSFN